MLTQKADTITNDRNVSSMNISSPNSPDPSSLSSSNTCNGKNFEFAFSSKGLHVTNLNVRHLLSKLDELRLILASKTGPDILGLCETFLDSDVPDNLISVADYALLPKDRGCTINKTGGGIVLYFRSSLNCNRKKEIEISNIETLWSEITFPNSKPFLLCTIYRPPNVSCDWIDLFEAELSIAQATGLEIILMGDFNINFLNCSNKKWLNLVELFDLKQMITTPTRVTQNTSSLIGHLYC